MTFSVQRRRIKNTLFSFSLFYSQQTVNDMKEENSDKQDGSYINTLYPEDQKRVDGFLSRGVNSVPRKPFRPGRLLLLLIVVVTVLSFFSQLVPRLAGIY